MEEVGIGILLIGPDDFGKRLGSCWFGCCCKDEDRQIKNE